MTKQMVIFGAGGHAKVVIDAVEREGKYHILGICDDDRERWGSEFFGYQIIGGRNSPIVSECEVLVAIGQNKERREITRDFEHQHRVLAVSVHPSAQLARGVALGCGTVVIAGATINSDSTIGRGVIVNSSAVIDHDCLIADYVHIAPGARLCGGVYVGERSLIGAGATVIPGVRIGSWVTVGAGACVIKDVPDSSVVVGVPARPVRHSRFGGYNES